MIKKQHDFYYENGMKLILNNTGITSLNDSCDNNYKFMNLYVIMKSKLVNHALHIFLNKAISLLVEFILVQKGIINFRLSYHD